MKLLWVDEQAPWYETAAELQWLHAKTIAEAQALLAHEADVQIAVVDLGLADSVEAMRLVRAAAPLATLIALSAGEQRGTVMGAVSAGAAGFIVKAAPPESVLAALRVVLDGGIPLPVSILERRAPDRPGYGTWTPTPRGPRRAGATRPTRPRCFGC